MSTPEKKDQNQRKPNKAAQVRHTSMLHLLANDPFLDWVLITATAFVTILALVGVGAYMYLDTGTRLGAEAPVVGRTAMSRINTKGLGNILDEFDRRAAERAVPAGKYVAPKDLSLP